MRTLARRLKAPPLLPPYATIATHLIAAARPHEAIASPADIESSQSKGHESLDSSTILQHLRSKRAPLALRIFQSFLQRSAAPDVLEQCIQAFGRYEQHESLKKALSLYLDHGYKPSQELWSQVLRVASLQAEGSPTDISPYFKQGLYSAINDEETLLSLIRYTSRFGIIEIGEALFMQYHERLQQASPNGNSEPAPEMWAALIEGRARVRDLDEAFAWFMRWRTSPNHPCDSSEEVYAMVEGHRFYGQRLASIPSSRYSRTRLNALRRVMSPNILKLQGDKLLDEDLDVSPSTVETEFRKPHPAPYLALLKAFSRPGDGPSQNLIDLMAVDDVPLITSTLNGLIESELARGESGQLASVLALYDKMRISSAASSQPSRRTFRAVFRTYREPRQSFDPKYPPMPTKLARKAQLPPPPEGYLQNPRRLFEDMCKMHSRLREEKRSNVHGLIDQRLLEDAVGAFVRTRDFVGAAAVLNFFKILRIEPSIRVHATITSGILRARQRREAFRRSDADYSLSDQEASRLQRHMTHLGVLFVSEWHKSPESDSSSLLSPAEMVDVPAATNLLNSVAATRITELQAQTWNDRLIPRSEYELRQIRRHELRYVSPLLDLLRRASGIDKEVWCREVGNLSNIFVHELRHRRTYSSMNEDENVE